MNTRPRRISMGCYMVEGNGQKIILRRVGRQGFKIERRPGAMAPTVKRLRDAAQIALDSINPWPFSVEKKFDAAADMPAFLRRVP